MEESSIDLVAIYAAIVGTLALLWQAYSWWSEQRVKVEVAITYGIGVGGVPDLVLIKAFNRSRKHSVRVESAGLGLQDGTGRYVPVTQHLAPEHRLPLTISPQDSAETALVARELEQGAGFDFTKPVVGRVHLSSGEWVYSKATTMISRD